MSFPSELVIQAAHFHPLGFLFRCEEEPGTNFLESLDEDVRRQNVFCTRESSAKCAIYFRSLPWDSAYFDIPTYRIEFISAAVDRKRAISRTTAELERLVGLLRESSRRLYLLAEVPSHAVLQLQALCVSGWRMVETRLTYYNEQIQQFDVPARFPVREARLGDIEDLRFVAASARNGFDRFHADPFFLLETADAFLSTYVENSVKGFADVTMVPDTGDGPPGAFLTANFLPPCDVLPGKKIAKMVLSAVGQARRGWYLKLISEMSCLFRERGVDVAYMTTQSTNRAVIRTWEKLGYSYGRSTHVFVKILDP